MRDVMRWTLKGFLPGVEGVCRAVMRPEVVMASDYDAVLTREAALREELAESGRADHLRQRIEFLTSEIHKQAERLTASEQRNAELVELLNFADYYLQEASFNSVGDVIEHTQEMRDQFRVRITTALKPAESGASHE